MQNNNIRLGKETISLIKNNVLKIDENAEIYIFVSRADPTRKGGDIDILIISEIFDFAHAQNLRISIQKLIGEQKIDIVYSKNKSSEPFVKIALEKAVRI